MEFWDSNVRPYLARIRWRSAGLNHDIRALTARPEFPTQAREDLADVRRELVRALARVDRAIAAYDSKPVMREAA